MELDKFIIRRTALGQDRWNRRYWWGLAGVRGAVVAEELAQPSGASTVSVIKDHVRAHCLSPTAGRGPPCIDVATDILPLPVGEPIHCNMISAVQKA